MSEHPPTFALDAHAAGDQDARVSQHVSSCATCEGYVRAIAEKAKAWSEGPVVRANSAEFVLALRERFEHSGQPPDAPSNVVPIAKERMFAPWMGWAAAPLIALAAMLVLVPRVVSRGAEEALPTGESSASSGAPVTRFKGNLQLAVVRDRSGHQSRLVNDVRVQSGDRLRVEISVDDTRPIEVGFLGKDGTWIVLLAPTLVEAGTHFSERAARFDETPTEGWILAGHPDEVARAKTSRMFDRVNVLLVATEP